MDLLKVSDLGFFPTELTSESLQLALMNIMFLAVPTCVILLSLRYIILDLFASVRLSGGTFGALNLTLLTSAKLPTSASR